MCLIQTPYFASLSKVSASDPSLQDALLSHVAELVVMAPPTSVTIREQDKVGQRGRANVIYSPPGGGGGGSAAAL